MRDVVLDAGALIALERNDRAIWAALRVAVSRGTDVIVPSTVLAQVWRGRASQAQLARALQFCAIAAFDPVAREVGELCGLTGTIDICDAHVAIVASVQGELLYTSDPGDLRRLLAAHTRRRVGVVRC